MIESPLPGETVAAVHELPSVDQDPIVVRVNYLNPNVGASTSSRQWGLSWGRQVWCTTFTSRILWMLVGCGSGVLYSVSSSFWQVFNLLLDLNFVSFREAVSCLIYVFLLLYVWFFCTAIFIASLLFCRLWHWRYRAPRFPKQLVHFLLKLVFL